MADFLAEVQALLHETQKAKRRRSHDPEAQGRQNQAFHLEQVIVLHGHRRQTIMYTHVHRWEMDGWMYDAWMVGWTTCNRMTHGRATQNCGMHGWPDGCCIDRWTVGAMADDGWMHGWSDEMMHRRMN